MFDLSTSHIYRLRIIDLGGFDGLVAEPQRNHRSIYTGLEQFHGSGMAKHVG
jgi:hypothetical protein